VHKLVVTVSKSAVNSLKKRMTVFLKSMLLSYLLTGALLTACAFFILKVEPGKAAINVLFMALYVIASGIGGYVCGKGMEHKRSLWGIVLGVCYFGILFLISFFVNQSPVLVTRTAGIPLFLCILGGMLGGIFSFN